MPREDLKNRIATIETTYEFMLSYAARGMQSDGASPLRSHLEKTAAALDGIGGAIRGVLAEAADGDAPSSSDSAPSSGSGNDAPSSDGAAPSALAVGAGPFIEVVERDAASSLAAVRMVLARDALSSQLIDNLNASIHVRALLTDLFLIDEALGLGVGESSPPAKFAPDEDEPFGPE